MTSKNFSSSKKFSEFLRQICTVAFLNPFLLLSPDSSFLVPLQCCWKRIKPSKSLQLSFYPNPMRGKRLCLETQCGEWGKCQVATHGSYFARYNLHFHPHPFPLPHLLAESRERIKNEEDSIKSGKIN